MTVLLERILHFCFAIIVEVHQSVFLSHIIWFV